MNIRLIKCKCWIEVASLKICQTKKLSRLRIQATGEVNVPFFFLIVSQQQKEKGDKM